MANAATPMMANAGLDWTGINAVAEHVIHLLETEGPAAAAVCADLLKMVQAITERDLSGIIGALTTGSTDVRKLVADLKTEFGV